MTENSKAIISVLVVLFVASVIGNFYLYKNLGDDVDCPSCDLNCPQLEEKALLDAQIYQWAQNEDNLDEMFFDYWIYNYGNVEARNIKVRCDLFEEDLVTKRTSVVDNYGNLASGSDGFGEVMIGQPVIREGEEFVGLCHVESCDNCEILYKRIPTLIESYEG